MRIITVPSFLFVAIIMLILSSSFSSLSLLFVNDANAQQLKPNALVTPTCGDTTEYKMTLHVNGFEPDSTVGWKLVNPETQTSSEYGYFSTNSTGGFSEPSVIEDEGLKEGKYDIQFFDDEDTDGNPDPGKKEFVVSMSIPCEEN